MIILEKGSRQKDFSLILTIHIRNVDNLCVNKKLYAQSYAWV